MNENIAKLYDEAIVLNGNSNYMAGELDAEKFAELIVRECIKVVDNMTDPEDSDRYFWAIQNASNNIRKHFGVKE